MSIGGQICRKNPGAQTIRQNAELPTSALLDALYRNILLGYSAEQGGSAIGAVAFGK